MVKIAETNRDNNESSLTDKEKEEIANLPIRFNLVKENQDYDNLSNRRVDLSRTLSKKLLKLCLIFNCLTMFFCFVSIAYAFLRPAPAYYASSPSGKVYGPLTKDKI